jgi:hypothetical protein
MNRQYGDQQATGDNHIQPGPRMLQVNAADHPQEAPRAGRDQAQRKRVRAPSELKQVRYSVPSLVYEVTTTKWPLLTTR